MRTPTAFLIPAALSAVLAGTGSAARAEDTPEGVEQLLPRGAIAAVFDPVYVPAAVAHIPDEAWIFGVVVEGQARAYSLNLLNHHEIVNDSIGSTAFATVW